jgi:predicted RNA binding protein YcfA (HicA-like mRNA interferase family)
MSFLPILSGEEVCKILKRFGYETDHQTGSHIILRNTEFPHRRVTIPNHKSIAKGTLRSIIRQVGLSVNEFKNL